ALASLPGDAVADGVFDYRLQKQVRHTGVHRVRLGFYPRRQAVLKTQPLDLQVAFQKLQLLLQGRLLLAGISQCHSEKFSQAGDHLVGGLHVFAHQRRDRMERVEKKMRVELHLQRSELRLRQLRLQLRGSELALLVAMVIIEGVAREEDRPVDQTPPGEAREEDGLKFRERRRDRIRPYALAQPRRNDYVNQ